MKPIRHVVGIAIALVLVVTTTSAFIRLSQPVGSSAALPAESTEVSVARAMHRIAAGTAGILFLVIVVLGWQRWRGDSRRVAAVALVVLAGFLAWLGKYAPSTLPAVMLGNLLGGMALLGLLAWLWQPDDRRSASPARLRLWTMVGLALAALQIALGAAMPITGLPVALAVLQNALASLVLIVLVSLLGRLGPWEKES